MQKVLFAIDFGNRQVKMISGNTKLVYPSYYMDKDDLNSTELFKHFGKGNQGNLDEYVTTKDSDFTFVWGKDLDVSNKKIIDTIAFDNRYTSDFRRLVDFSLAELTRQCDGENAVEVTLITGVPTYDYYQDKVLNQLSEAVKGSHTVLINNRSYFNDVTDVHVLPQNIGTLFDLILDDEGEMIDSPLVTGDVAIVDLGGGTILMDYVSNMSLNKEMQVQLDDGAYSLYNAITGVLFKRGYKTNEYEVERLIRAGNKEVKPKYVINTGKSVEDITDLVMKHRKSYTRLVSSKIKSTFKAFNRSRSTLITGGGSNLLIKSEVEKEIPNVEFVEDAEMANVRGFYKYGLSLQRR